MFAQFALQQRRTNARYLVSLLIFQLFLLPFLLGGGCSSETKLQVDSAPSPRSLLLLFPRDNRIDRAVITDLEEYRSGMIEVIVNENETEKISVAEFTLTSSPDRESRLLTGLNDTLVKWGKETDYRKVHFSSTNGVNRLEVHGKKGLPPHVYFYRLSDTEKLEFMDTVNAR